MGGGRVYPEKIDIQQWLKHFIFLVRHAETNEGQKFAGPLGLKMGTPYNDVFRSVQLDRSQGKDPSIPTLFFPI